MRPILDGTKSERVDPFAKGLQDWVDDAPVGEENSRITAMERMKEAKDNRSLNLGGLGLSSLPSQIGDLPNLTKLNLRNNKLNTIPDFLLKETRPELSVDIECNPISPYLLLTLQELLRRNGTILNIYMDVRFEESDPTIPQQGDLTGEVIAKILLNIPSPTIYDDVVAKLNEKFSLDGFLESPDLKNFRMFLGQCQRTEEWRSQQEETIKCLFEITKEMNRSETVKIKCETIAKKMTDDLIEIAKEMNQSEAVNAEMLGENIVASALTKMKLELNRMRKEVKAGGSTSLDPRTSDRFVDGPHWFYQASAGEGALRTEAMKRMSEVKAGGSTSLDLSTSDPFVNGLQSWVDQAPSKIEKDSRTKAMEKMMIASKTSGSISLNLMSHHLSSLPSQIWDLTNLTELDLCFNDLTTLPSEIKNLTALTELDLSHNRLTILPPETGKLVNLNSLNLSSNKLTNLSPFILEEARPKLVNLENNQIPREVADELNVSAKENGVNLKISPQQAPYTIVEPLAATRTFDQINTGFDQINTGEELTIRPELSVSRFHILNRRR